MLVRWIGFVYVECCEGFDWLGEGWCLSKVEKEVWKCGERKEGKVDWVSYY